MQGPNPDWQSDDEELEILEEDPDWVMPDFMDFLTDPGDVPPPPFETDIGAYTAQFPNIF